GRRIRAAAAAPHFEVELGAADPGYLADHRILGAVIAPSPVLLAMPPAAAAEVPGAHSIALDEFTIEQSMVLPEVGHRLVQTVVTPAGDLQAEIEVLSLDDGAGESWRRHARVRARAGDAPLAEPRLDLDAVRARCTDVIEADEYYAMLRDRGLDFGPAFRSIARVHRGDREAIAELRVPAGLRPDEFEHVHPAVLDACLQALGGAWRDAPAGSWLVIGADTVRLGGRGGQRLFSHAVLHDAAEDAELIGA